MRTIRKTKKDWRRFPFEIQWKICGALSVITSWLGIPLQWIIAGILPVPSSEELPDGFITILLVDVLLCWLLPVNILHKLANWISHAHLLCYTSKAPPMDLFVLNWLVLNTIDSWYGPSEEMPAVFPWNFLAANAITSGVLFFWLTTERIVDPGSSPLRKTMKYALAIGGIILGIISDMYGMLWESIILMSVSLAVYKYKQMANELDATKTQLGRYKDALEKTRAQMQRNTEQYNLNLQKTIDESKKRLKQAGAELEAMKSLMEKHKLEAQKSMQQFTELTQEHTHVATQQLEANNAVKFLIEKTSSDAVESVRTS